VSDLHRRALVAVAAVVAAGTALGACGVPIDAQPTALAPDRIPFGLLAPESATTTTTSIPSPVEAPVAVYFLGPTGHLVPVARDVPVSAPDLTSILDALVAGPTETEAASGLQSALSAQTTVLGATVTDGIATVNLTATFGQLVGPPQIEAVAQVVFTASGLSGVKGVTFQLSGQPIDVPVASGAQVPVADISQFASLAPVAPARGSPA